MRRGFTLIELMIVIAIIAIIAAIAIPNLIEARKGSNEAAAIGALRSIGTAQLIFRNQDKDQNSVNDYATSMASLGTAGLIDNALASGTKQGYLFAIKNTDFAYTLSITTSFGAGQVSNNSPVGRNDQFQAIASPQVPAKSGDRNFWIDESGVIRFVTTSGALGATSPAIGG